MNGFGAILIFALLVSTAHTTSATKSSAKSYHEIHHGPIKKSFSATLIKGIAGIGQSMYSIGSSNEVSDGSEDKNPTGGAPCENDDQCGGRDFGTCKLETKNNITSGKCECSYKRGDVDCSYKRKNGQLAGGLQFLCFAGVGGVGNFILERTGAAVGQLILLAISLCACCAAICGVAVAGVSGSDGAAGGVTACIGLCICCASFAGLIWCIVDGAMILEGEVLDGNGYKPYFP